MTREPAPAKSYTLWLEAIVNIHSGTELIMVRRLGARTGMTTRARVSII